MLALVLLARQRQLRVLATLGALFLVAAVPTYQFWPATENIKDLRLFYLPGIAVATLLAVGGWKTGVLALLAGVLPFLQLREEHQANWQDMRTYHHGLLMNAPDIEQDLVFIHGLPRDNPQQTAIAFHLGVDRLLQLPFGRGRQRSLALRPLHPGPDAHVLPYAESKIHGLPFGRTMSFGSPGSLNTRLPNYRAKELVVEYHGPEVLTLDVVERAMRAKLDPHVRISGMRALRYRVTVFTAGGYLTGFVKDESRPDARDGRFSIRAVLFAFHKRTGQKGDEIALSLIEPSALDLDLRFPMLVEADENDDGAGGMLDFQVSHTNRRPLYLQLDRSYATFVRR